MDPHADPLRPTGTVTRVQLELYALGKLNAAERRHVELHLEHDPLLREAMEGLLLPGAVAGAGALQYHKPAGKGPVVQLLLMAGTIVAGLAAIVILVNEEPVARPTSTEVLAVPDQPFKADSAIAVVDHELVEAKPLPAKQQIGHDTRSHTTGEVLDTTTIRTLAPHHDTIPKLAIPPAPAAGPTPAPSARPVSNRKIAFLHDLKLVDPKELYDKGPLIMETGGVPAGFADDVERDQRNEEPRTMRYLDYMDGALGKFVRNDHRGCLQDLLFLMGQYPKDINARFYAGLCCYNLGLQDRAKGYLSAVVSDPIDTFREEAEWYLALTIERAEGLDAARARLELVKAGGGLYALQAAEKLQP